MSGGAVSLHSHSSSTACNAMHGSAYVLMNKHMYVLRCWTKMLMHKKEQRHCEGYL